MGFNTYNADWAGNDLLYNTSFQIAGSGQTIGYTFLTNLAKMVGLDYFGFRVVASAIALLLLALFIVRYTRNAAFVLALYLITPFLYDVVQFRFYLASSVAVFGLRLLIEGTGKQRAYYLMFLFAATLIHPGCVLFAFFFIGCLPEKRALQVGVVAALLVLVGSYSGALYPIASYFMDSAKISAYFTTMARFGFLPYWISVLASVVMIAGTRMRSSNSSDSFVSAADDLDPVDRRSLMFNDFLRKAIFAYMPIAALMPLSTQNFYRIIRSVLLLIYIHYANLTNGVMRGLVEKQDIKIFTLLFWVWFAFTAYIIFHGVWDLVVLEELANNLFWS